MSDSKLTLMRAARVCCNCLNLGEVDVEGSTILLIFEASWVRLSFRVGLAVGAGGAALGLIT